MADDVRFSVIIPVHNRARTIEATLRSVATQTYGNFECIIVDDGSDDSAELQQVLHRLGDSRFAYRWRANGGGGAARNTGIDCATGDYVAFLDSDDLFLPHKLDSFRRHILGYPMDAYYSPALVDRGEARMWVRPDRAIGSQEDMGEYLFVHNQFVQTSTIVMATAAARRVRFDPSLRKGQDLDFCVRAHHAGLRFVMLDEPLVIWCDLTEENRTSRFSGHQAPSAWLAAAKPLLTQKAQRGYRATTLAYYLAGEHPFLAARDLLAGLFLAGVPARVILRQFARCFVPATTYRKMVNAVVRHKGVQHGWR
jgi:glycosyltransferase involved in cell wall biosynthesis